MRRIFTIRFAIWKTKTTHSGSHAWFLLCPKSIFNFIQADLHGYIQSRHHRGSAIHSRRQCPASLPDLRPKSRQEFQHPCSPLREHYNHLSQSAWCRSLPALTHTRFITQTIQKIRGILFLSLIQLTLYLRSELSHHCLITLFAYKQKLSRLSTHIDRPVCRHHSYTHKTVSVPVPLCQHPDRYNRNRRKPHKNHLSYLSLCKHRLLRTPRYNPLNL